MIKVNDSNMSQIKKFTEELIEKYFVENNDFLTLKSVEIKGNSIGLWVKTELLGDNGNEGFDFGFGILVYAKTETGDYDEKTLLQNLQKSFNKLIAKFKLNLDYEKELIDSGDLERWVKQDGFTLENLLECKKEYMGSLDIAVNRINKDINEYLKNKELSKGEER